MSRAVDSSRVVNIDDLRRLAERRLPRAVFDYIDGGADAEVTLGENCRVFDDVILRPRNAVAIPQCDLPDSPAANCFREAFAGRWCVPGTASSDTCRPLPAPPAPGSS